MILIILVLRPTNILQKWAVYFSSVEFFKQHNVYGVRCQVSVFRCQEDTEDRARKQMTACDDLPSTNSGLEPVESSRVEDKGQTVSAFCHLLSDT